MTIRLEPNGFKTREGSLRRKNRGLVSEIEALWSRKLPKNAGQAIPWLVYRALTNDLGSQLPSGTLEVLDEIAVKRSVRELVGAQQYASPQKYCDARGYFAAAACLSLLKKYPWGEGEMDPEAKAIERFWAAEMRCRNANKRLKHYRQFDFSDSRPLTKRLDVHRVFHLARRKIQNWLGPVVPGDVLAHARHGPGGCVGLKRPLTTPYYKFGVGDYTVSAGAYWHAARVVCSSDAWVKSLLLSEGVTNWEHDVRCVPLESKLKAFDSRVSVVNYNEVTFVPKDAKTHRSIAIEPRLNVALQLSAGGVIRDALKRVGCDLTDQTRNQELARVGSLVSSNDDPYDPATLDLEMASDTLPYELVKELLPEDWFELLDSLRSREGLLKGNVIKWEKFSSMGNGFTFELESLIFYSLAQAVSDLTGTTQWFSDTFGPAYKYAYVSVYGDDIIVPKVMTGHLIEVLRFCGFRVNAEKTFVDGPFRESCGKDYFNGVNVRPFLLTRKLDRIRDLVHLRNGLKLMGAHRGIDLTETVRLVDSLLPETLKRHLTGWIETDGDGYIWEVPDVCHRSRLVVYDSDFQSWIHPTFRERPRTFEGRVHWRYCQYLYANTGVGVPREEPTYRHRDEFRAHLSQGGSSGEVVRSGIVKPVMNWIN